MRLLLALLLCVRALAGQGNNDDKANQELAQELEGFGQQAEQVLEKVDKISQVVPVSAQRVDQVKEKALKLANDDRFLKSAESLWQNEKRNTMLLIQAGWFLFMLLFKAWRQSRSPHWFRRLLVGFACSVLTWAGILYVIPLLVLGEPFAVFTSTLWRVIVMGG